MSGDLDLALHAGLDGLEALAPAWWRLWRRAPSATPFQSPAWALPWARRFCRDDEPLALTLHRDGRLVALLALTPVDDAHGRRLLPLGAGISDYLDGVFAADAGPAEAAVLLSALTRMRGLDLPQLPPASPLLAAPAPPGWGDWTQEGEPCPVVPLPAVLPARMAQTVRTQRRRAERAGVRSAEATRPDEVADLLEALFALHAARWRARGEAGVFSTAAVQAFHREAAPLLARAGLLRLIGLFLRHTPVAVLYVLTDGRRAYDYIGGFDPAHAELGLGTLAIAAALEAAARDGATGFDFLRGREPYKYRWGAVDQPTLHRRLRAPECACARAQRAVGGSHVDEALAPARKTE